MAEVFRPDSPCNRGDPDAPHLSPVTPAEDARTIMINKISWGAVSGGRCRGTCGSAHLEHDRHWHRRLNARSGSRSSRKSNSNRIFYRSGDLVDALRVLAALAAAMRRVNWPASRKSRRPAGMA